jgi:hypothetical protein
VASLSPPPGYLYDGHSLGWIGAILVCVTLVLRIGFMLWRRRSGRRR